MPRRKPTSVERVQQAKRELKTLDFKESFNPAVSAEWPELVKDFAAMANSAGGLIVIGVCNDGTVATKSVAAVLSLDPAKITDQIERYTGTHFGDIEIIQTRRGRKNVAIIAIGDAGDTPLVFIKPGTYVPAGETSRQKTAFLKGTVYFRHGAKSEPGTTADLRAFIERRVEKMRDVWLGRVLARSPHKLWIALELGHHPIGEHLAVLLRTPFRLMGEVGMTLLRDAVGPWDAEHVVSIDARPC